MARRRSDVDAQLEALYDAIPPLKCKGLCVDSCEGGIPSTRRERARMKAATGATLLPLSMGNTDQRCPALVDGQCSAYEKRPFICRLWGVSENMPCHYGCVPTGGHLPVDQARALAEALEDLDGAAL